MAEARGGGPVGGVVRGVRPVPAGNLWRPNLPDEADNPGLYVHVPFCSAICPYCDFAVAVGREEKRRAYVAALCRETAYAADFPDPFDTVYFGGGTPSLLHPEHLAEILDAIRDGFHLEEGTSLSRGEPRGRRRPSPRRLASARILVPVARRPVVRRP